MGTTTVSEIHAIIERLEKVKNFTTNVLVVDYADVLAASKRQKEFRHNLTAIYTELKELARNKNIIVWTASQFNAEGTKESLKESGTISTTHGNESSAKSHYADMIIGIARTKDEIENGAARLIIVKNRIGGGQGFTLKVFPDLSRARLFTGRFEPVGHVDVEKPIEGLETLDENTDTKLQLVRAKSFAEVYGDPREEG
jgi:replicative DNA helicase